MSKVLSLLTTNAALELAGQATSMVREIASYKRAIAELQLQRENMQHQAHIMQQKIQAQAQLEGQRIHTLSASFSAVLENSKRLIEEHGKCCTDNHALCGQIMQYIATAQAANLPALQAIWKDLLQQMQANRDVAQALHHQLLDAHIQFGISLSQRDQSWQTVTPNPVME